MSSKDIPFEFVLDRLVPVEIRVRPMFGMYAVYEGDKILLMLRRQESKKELNGIWIATEKEYARELSREITSLKSIKAFSDERIKSEWMLLSESIDDFESSAIDICERILKGDNRIGKTSYSL